MTENQQTIERLEAIELLFHGNNGTKGVFTRITELETAMNARTKFRIIVISALLSAILGAVVTYGSIILQRGTTQKETNRTAVVNDQQSSYDLENKIDKLLEDNQQLLDKLNNQVNSSNRTRRRQSPALPTTTGELITTGKSKVNKLDNKVDTK